MSLTPEQIEERLGAITGSDVAVILGVSPWKTAVDLWREKMRLSVPEDISGRKAIIRGNYLEDAVANWWSDNTGKAVEIDKEFLRHKEYPWMRGNIDRRVTGERAILECKTSRNSFGWDEASNMVPIYYLLQLAHYVAVDDAEVGYMAVFIGGTDEFMRFTYERNLKLEEKMISKLKHFWEENILKQIPPEPTCLKDIISLHGTRTDIKPIQVPADDDSLEKAVQNLKFIKEEKGKLEKSEVKLKDQVAVYMNTHDTLVGSGGDIIATWKATKPFDDFNEKQFKVDEPDLYKKYCVKKVQRRMLIK